MGPFRGSFPGPRGHTGAARGKNRMDKRRTFGQYRAIDLAMWALMVAVFEYLLVHAARVWYADQLYTVSLAGALTAILYMRWGAWGALHAAEAALVYCFFSAAAPQQYLIYCLGNLFSLLALLMLKAMGKERVRASAFWSVAFGLLVLLLMQAGRAALALALGAAPASVVGFFTTDSLSLLFTGLIVWIARKLDGVYEDQKHYLLRTQAQEEHKGGNL